MAGGIWKGSISFGLLNIPVSLQTAQEEKELHFSMLDSKNLSPIKYKKTNAKTGQEVPYKRIVKGYEYEKGQYVVLNEKDFKAANVKATQTIDIENFVLLEEIDLMIFDRPYYLVPQKNGEKGYFLLRDALEKSKKVAIGKVVIRTKQHLAMIVAREDYLILELLRFSHEVLEIHEVDYLKGINTKARYAPREMKMAEELIKSMTAKWEPDQYEDTYQNDLMKRIKQKIKAGEGHEIEEPEEIESDDDSKPSKVTDLLPLLRQSIAAKKVHKHKIPLRRAKATRVVHERRH